MKKGLIFATTLAMALGVGVAVGAHQNEVAEVKAANATTLYLDTNDLTWYGNMSRAHLFGSGGNNGWPGQELTHVSGSIYKLDIPDSSKYQNVIFLRSNGTDVWNRTSKDGGTAINLPANWTTQNMWKFSGWNGNEYDDGNYTGSWTLYTPPAVTYNVTCVVDGKAEESPVEVGEGEIPDLKNNTYLKSFDGWYTASDYKTKVTEITSDCSVYGRFVDKETATYTIDDGYAKKFDAYNVYAWNEDGNNAEWPGLAVNGKAVTVPVDASFIINDGDAQQTVNISQEGAKAYLQLLSETDESGHFKVQWSDAAQEVPASEGYYIKGSASEWKYVAANKMSTEDLNEGDVAQFIGFEAKANDEIRICSYYINRSPFEQWASLQDGESEVGTLVGDNLKFTADGTYDIYAKYVGDQFLFDVLAHEEPEPADVPETDGYYLISSLTNYKYAGATPMPQVDPSTGNVAVLLDYDPKPGEKIKARSYFSGEDKYSANVDGEKEYGKTDSDLNFEFADTIGEDDTFDIYAYYDGDTFLFSVAPHAERVTVSIVAKEYAGSHYQGETSVLYKDEEVIKGNTFIVPDVTPEGYVALGVYSDFNCTVPFISGETKVESTMMLHVKVMQLGWYLAGGEDETFSVENSMKLGTSAGNKCTGAVEVPEGTDDDNPFIVKPLEYVADAGSGKPGWASATYEMGHEGDPLFVHIDEETSNFIFTVPGTYAFYVNNENKVWFNGGEYAYIEDFLSHTGTVCHTQGTQTDLDLLQLLWAQFEEGFKGLSEDEAKDIKDVGFNGGDEKSDDAKLRMVARYAYIVTKYGTAMFKDFIWNKSVEAKPSSSIAFSSSEVNNSTMIIVISIAAVSALAFTTLLVIKKRKQK